MRSGRRADSRRFPMIARKLFATVAVLVSCAGAASAQTTAKASLKDAKGADAGSADLIQVSDGVLLKITLKGIPAGQHAVHIHAVGKCEPPFTTAGGHFNPDNK